MIKAVSLDVEDMFNILGTNAATESTCRDIAEITGKSYSFVFNKYQGIRRYVRAHEFQTEKRYNIAYRLTILSRNSGMKSIIPYIEEIAERHYETEKEKTILFPEDVSNFIYELNGRYMVGITSDSRHIVSPNMSSWDGALWLQRIGVDTTVFDFIISIEKSGKKTKRTGYPYEILLEELKPFGIMPDQIVHIGDSRESDIEPAEKLGMHTILFDPREHYTSPDRCDFSPVFSQIKELDKL